MATRSAGTLDRKITIQRATTVADAFNEPIETWVDLATVRACYIPTGGRVSGGTEDEHAEQISASMLSQFVIRSSSTVADVNPKDRLIFEGRPWNIATVGEADKAVYRGRYMVIAARVRTDE